MSVVRLPLYAAALVAIAALGYVLSLSGLVLCSPPPLPGDEWWAWKERAAQAFLVLSGAGADCFLPTAGGRLALRAGEASLTVLVAAALLAVLWEGLGIRLRRALRARRGGHAVLFGEPQEIEAFAASLGGMARAFVARTRAAALAIGRRLPFAEVSVLADRRDAAGMLAAQGAGRAALVAAATASDLANSEFAEAALAAGGAADILVRLEQGQVRALKGDTLRHAAGEAGRRLTVISLRLIQARQALALAMPGRYAVADAPRAHVVLCGAGPMMQAMAFLVAHQGYGLDRAVPLLSILRTGRGDFGPGALERLTAAEAIAVEAVAVDGEDASGIDRAFAAIALNPAAPVAVHCCEEDEGGAIALALRIERVMADLDMPVPPIVVHGAAGGQFGDTGMIRAVETPTLAEARDKASLMDARAKAFHEAYLEGQRAASGAAFGKLPAERDWQDLPEQFREDNRAAADHIGYKLAFCGFVAASGEGEPARIAAHETERLAALEHARWMARRSVSGWRYGATRDDRTMLHPDMKPYAELDEDARRKDREQVAVLIQQLARGGERPVRLVRHAFLSANGARQAIDALKRRDGRRGERPLVAVTPETADGIAVAEAALEAGLPIEAIVTRAPEQIHGDAALARRAATVLRQSWRIIAAKGRDPLDLLAGADRVLVDREGNLDTTLLA